MIPYKMDPLSPLALSPLVDFLAILDDTKATKITKEIDKTKLFSTSMGEHFTVR